LRKFFLFNDNINKKEDEENIISWTHKIGQQ